MADDFDSPGAVGQAINGLRDQLKLHTYVFGGVFTLAVAVFSGVFLQINGIKSDISDLKVSNARIEERLINISSTLATMSTKMKVEASLPSEDAFSGFIGEALRDKSGIEKAVKAIEDGSYTEPVWIFRKAE